MQSVIALHEQDLVSGIPWKTANGGTTQRPIELSSPENTVRNDGAFSISLASLASMTPFWMQDKDATRRIQEVSGDNTQISPRGMQDTSSGRRMMQDTDECTQEQGRQELSQPWTANPFDPQVALGPQWENPLSTLWESLTPRRIVRCATFPKKGIWLA